MFTNIGPLPMSTINELRKTVSSERNADKTTYKNRNG